MNRDSPVSLETPANEPTASSPTPLSRAAGCPFIVGRPLRTNEPIFGREEAFRFLADQLAQFSSVNIVGERRMGKTSLLNHLLGNQSKYITQSPQSPPLVLARVDLQGGVSDAIRFYGTALRELLTRLLQDRVAAASALGPCMRGSTGNQWRAMTSFNPHYADCETATASTSAP